MTRLNIFVEGQTEETFVRSVLAPYWLEKKIYPNAILVRTSSQSKGGLVSYPKIKRQIDIKCKEDRKAYVTTLFDLFRLPSSFPGFENALNLSDPFKKAHYIQQQMDRDIEQQNFFANLMVHEFEAILYSGPTKFSNYFAESIVNALQSERKSFETPEHVNGGENTAPSKRIIKLCPHYKKPVDGPLIAQDIGIDIIRKECRYFHMWLERVENLTSV